MKLRGALRDCAAVPKNANYEDGHTIYTSQHFRLGTDKNPVFVRCFFFGLLDDEHSPVTNYTCRYLSGKIRFITGRYTVTRVGTRISGL